MVPHPDLYEKLITEHHAQIRHDIQRNRVPAHAGQRRRLARSIIGRLGTLMVVLGSYLQRMGQQSGASFHSS